jgi:hypothetical protein
MEGTAIWTLSGCSWSARYASFSHESKTSPMPRCTNVVVAPRAPESSIGTFFSSWATNALAVASVPPGSCLAYNQAAR